MRERERLPPRFRTLSESRWRFHAILFAHLGDRPLGRDLAADHALLQRQILPVLTDDLEWNPLRILRLSQRTSSCRYSLLPIGPIRGGCTARKILQRDLDIGEPNYLQVQGCVSRNNNHKFFC